MDYEFYDQPTEFDMQIDEFKQSLMTSVKAEYIEKMEKLQKENSELQETKKKFNQIVADYKSKERELERKMQDAASEARKMRLNELMKDRELILYKVGYEYKNKPKCDLCDNNRYIIFVSPAGKKHQVPCDCNTRTYIYLPEATAMYEFSLDSNRSFSAWYKKTESTSSDYFQFASDYSAEFAKTIYSSDKNFADLERHNTYFKSIEDCQKYCDWLNEKEKK